MGRKVRSSFVTVWALWGEADRPYSLGPLLSLATLSLRAVNARPYFGRVILNVYGTGALIVT